MTPWVDESNASLLTDLYELTMLQAYFDQGLSDIAAFDLFVRRLPQQRNYLVACGLDHVLGYLENLSFSDAAIEYLHSLKLFSGPFLDSLREFHFSGDVYAVPEGTIVFGDEPILEVVAPLSQAQLIETFVMNQIHFSTMAASKASRVVSAGKGRRIVDYGLRRIHGADAGLKASRAFYIAGVDSTSNVLAGQFFGIPVAGTMAHSYVQVFDSELEAFRCFLQSYPEGILLVDTYDTLKGVEHVIQLAKELGSAFRVPGIRLDSGDLTGLSRRARSLLDSAGLQRLKIFASSSLDEYAIEALVLAGAPIDGFGVGVNMGTSEDAPFLDTVYKLAEYAGRPKMKLSRDKATLPARKQVFRTVKDGRAQFDVIGCVDEPVAGEKLLVKVMERGRRVGLSPTLEQIRTRCREAMDQMPEHLTILSSPSTRYPIHLSPELTRLQSSLRRELLS